MEIGRSGRVQVEDIVFLVRKDAKKYARVKELLMMNEELKKARKAFDEGKFAGKIFFIYIPENCIKIVFCDSNNNNNDPFKFPPPYEE